jgi:histidinol-phosphate aminotransferase
VRPSEVILGCGSGDIIDCAFRAFGPVDGSVAFLSPTFVMTPVLTRTNGLRPIPIPLTVDHDVDADAVLGSGCDITYLCSPNNPTGGLLSDRAVERVLAQAPGLIMLDEAYAEYAGRSHAALAPGHGRLLVIRTFSKAFGLAGLRIGYGIGAESVIRELEKVRGPFRITSIGEAAAIAALTHDLAWVHRVAGETVRIREDTLASLRSAGWSPLRSDANFFLLPVRDAASAAAGLLERGIHVRALAALPGIGDALRITVGPRDVMQFVLDALRDVA